MELGQAGAVGVGQEEVDGTQRAQELLLDPLPELVEAGTGDRRDEYGVAVGVAHAGQLVGVEQVDLVEHANPRVLAGADLLEHLLDRAAHRLQLVLVDGGVLDVEDQGGPAGLLEGGGEGVDQLMGKLADEADRVGGQVGAPIDQQGPGQRVEGVEEAVGDGNGRSGQGAEQR